MFLAINKTTGNLINSISIEFTNEFLKQEEWFAYPCLIEYCPEGTDINKIIVNYRNESKDIISKGGQIFRKSPHFYIPNATKLGIKLVPDLKEHTDAVNMIYSLLKDKKINFLISKQNKPEKENILTINNEEIDINNINIEVTITSKNSKRADILLPFKKYNDLLGFGVIIEIQFTKQSNNQEEERSYERAIKGFSVCWLKKEFFDDEKTDKIVPIVLMNNIIKDYLNNKIEHLKQITINYSSMLDEREKKIKKMLDLKISLPDCAGKCNKCKEGILILKKGKNKQGNDYCLYVCSYCGEKMWVTFSK